MTDEADELEAILKEGLKFHEPEGIGIVTDEAKPFFTAEDFQDPIQEAVYLDLSYEAAKQIADHANARVQPVLDENARLKAESERIEFDTECPHCEEIVTVTARSVAPVRRERDALRKENAKLKAQANRIGEDYVRCNQERLALREENARLKEQLADGDAYSDRLKRELARLKAVIDVGYTTRPLSEIEAENMKLREERDAMRAALERIGNDECSTSDSLIDRINAMERVACATLAKYAREKGDG